MRFIASIFLALFALGAAPTHLQGPWGVEKLTLFSPLVIGNPQPLPRKAGVAIYNITYVGWFCMEENVRGAIGEIKEL